MSETFLTLTEQTDRKGELVFLLSVEVQPAPTSSIWREFSDKDLVCFMPGKKTVKWFSGWTGPYAS